MNPQTDLPTAQPVSPVAVPLPGSPRTVFILRLSLLLVAAGLAGVFAVAFWLNPYGPDGTPRVRGTHQQLGLPPCNFMALSGKPCPSCGMTTSFALLVRGDVEASLRANWAGTILALVWAVTLVWALASAVWGRPLFVPRGYGELVLTTAVGLILALMLTRWVIVLVGGEG